MRVKSILPLSDSELKRIQYILRESRFIHESLRTNFPEAYYRIDEQEKIIYFGRHSYDYTYELF